MFKRGKRGRMAVIVLNCKCPFLLFGISTVGLWSACANSRMTHLMCGGCMKTLLGQVSRGHFGHVLHGTSLELQYSQQTGTRGEAFKVNGLLQRFLAARSQSFFKHYL